MHIVLFGAQQLKTFPPKVFGSQNFSKILIAEYGLSFVCPKILLSISNHRFLCEFHFYDP